MEIYVTLFALLVASMSLGTSIVVFRHFRQLEKKKNKTYMRQLREHGWLVKERERIAIEKEILEKLLHSMIKHASRPEGTKVKYEKIKITQHEKKLADPANTIAADGKSFLRKGD